jgi:formylglycine-generating enzyme required for sulfatase activity/pimeloyl-ACP methyl ester carboxylesterase
MKRLLSLGVVLGCLVGVVGCGGGSEGSDGGGKRSSSSSVVSIVSSSASSGMEISELLVGDENGKVYVFPSDLAQTPITIINNEMITDYEIQLISDHKNIFTVDKKINKYLLIIDTNGVGSLSTIPFTLRLRRISTNQFRDFDSELVVMDSREVAHQSVGHDGGFVGDKLLGIGVDIEKGQLLGDVDISVLVGDLPSGKRRIKFKFEGVNKNDEAEVKFIFPERAENTELLQRKLNRSSIQIDQENLKKFTLSGAYPIAYNWIVNMGSFVENGHRFKVKPLKFSQAFLTCGIDLYETFACFEEAEASRLDSSIPRSNSVNWENNEPVLFVHGYSTDVFSWFRGAPLGGGEGTWKNFPELVSNLKTKDGVSYIPFEFRWVTDARIEDVAGELVAAIVEIHKQSGKKVHIVAHSFGGVLVRTALQKINDGTVLSSPERYIKNVITLGTPHSGIADNDYKKMHGQLFMQGQDGVDIFEGCDQISCHQMGESIFLGADTSRVSKDFAYILSISEEPGELAAKISDTDNYKLPDNIPIVVGIGLTFDRGSTAALDNGDALITYAGQRFHPSKTNQGNVKPLLDCENEFGSPIKEIILGVTSDVRPGDSPSITHVVGENGADEIGYVGYKHSSIPPSVSINPSLGWISQYLLGSEAAVECRYNEYCNHASYKLVETVLSGEVCDSRQDDSDGDGVSDPEDLWPNDPAYAFDKDKDGMPDEWETIFGLIIGEDDSLLDLDGDGVSNLDEFKNGTDPKKNDISTPTILEPEMVAIPGTTYSMSKYETTFAQYDVYAEETGVEKPSDEGWGRGNRPVINVSWHDAVAYAAWLSQKTGKKYRLPTEEEWEFSARAGTTTNYSWGDDIGINNANCQGCGSQWDGIQTAPVGSFQPNGFGLFDIHGNVFEWTSSCLWVTECGRRISRGGAWYTDPHILYSVNPVNSIPSLRNSAGGFRLVQDNSALTAAVEPEMVTIPGTNYSMSKYETTFDQYNAYVNDTDADSPSDEGWGRGSRPVINVSWDDAMAYAAWLSQETGKNYRLPTEEEWEFSARAGSTTNYFWGDKIDVNKANCKGCGIQWDGATAPVGSFLPNGFGLFDVHGNVWEMTTSCWRNDCSGRVLRGGSWTNYPDYLSFLYRSDVSDIGAAIPYSSYVGFRLVQDALAQASSSTSSSIRSSASSANQSLNSSNSSSSRISTSSVSGGLQSSRSSASSSRSQSSQPISNAISGAWVASESCHWANPLCDSWLVFLDESNYFSIQTSQPDDGCTVGVEKGTYARNAVTGAFQVSPQFDGNNHCGVSDAGTGATLVLNGNQLSYKEVANSTPIGFVKASAGSTHMGTWIISENNHTEVLVLAETMFIRAIYKNGVEDVELGYYGYNQSTGEFQVTNFTKDKNTANSGFTGLSNIKVVVNNNQLTVTSDPNPNNPSVFSRLQ